jgi:hypothetical protein
MTDRKWITSASISWTIVRAVIIAGLVAILLPVYVWFGADRAAQLAVYNHCDEDVTIRYRATTVVVPRNTYSIFIGVAKPTSITMLNDSEHRYSWWPSTHWPYFYRGTVACQIETKGRFYHVPIGESAIDKLFPADMSDDWIPIPLVNEE